MNRNTKVIEKRVSKSLSVRENSMASKAAEEQHSKEQEQTAYSVNIPHMNLFENIVINLELNEERKVMKDSNVCLFQNSEVKDKI